MGSCAKVWALANTAFLPVLNAPIPDCPDGVDPKLWQQMLAGEPVRDDRVREEFSLAAELVFWEQTKLYQWQDDCDNYLSRFFQGENLRPLARSDAAQIFGRDQSATRESYMGQDTVLFRECLNELENRAFERFMAVLGIPPARPKVVPWWVRAQFSAPGDGYEVGILKPDEVVELAQLLTQSELIRLATAWGKKTNNSSNLEKLANLIENAANHDCWLLGVEGQSLGELLLR